MKTIGWFLRLVFFAVVLWFALKNTTPVPIRLTSTLAWVDVPLIIVILSCVLLGVLAGVLAMLPRLLRLKREVSLLTRTSGRTTSAAAGAGAGRGAAAEAEADSRADRLAAAARNVGAVGQLDADTRTRP